MTLPPNQFETLSRNRQAKWGEFLAFVDRHAESHWIFRGVGDSRFELTPKIGRDTRLYNEKIEGIIFQNFKRRARQFINTTGLADWDVLSLAQQAPGGNRRFQLLDRLSRDACGG